MTTCKDCYYHSVCEYDVDRRPEFCNSFKDKSKIIELPSKFGDVLYHHDEMFGILEYSLQSVCGAVLGIQFEAYAYDADGTELLDAIDFEYEEIGKTVFLTREEAEKALNERRVK